MCQGTFVRFYCRSGLEEDNGCPYYNPIQHRVIEHASWWLHRD